jgi:hypothetical protein
VKRLHLPAILSLAIAVGLAPRAAAQLVFGDAFEGATVCRWLPSVVSGSCLTVAEADALRAVHDDTRANASPTPMPPLTPLSWDPRLAQVAKEYADSCPFLPGTCIALHNPNSAVRYLQLGGSGPVGENLAWGSAGLFTVADFASFWASEAANYDYATNTCAVGQSCGHYTQMVWRATLRFGCGRATCVVAACTPTGVVDLLACNYSPAGNTGTRPY